MVLQNPTLCLIRKGEDCNAAPLPRQGKNSSEKHCFWNWDGIFAGGQKSTAKTTFSPTLQNCYNRAGSGRFACHCQIFVRFWGQSIL